ncbi:hypothetical protein EKD04_022585 [Chloroflexales bacterium ZM16-3]|nr:hypothetical protein [Chloroflexales bacterium ZM16-3]
MGHSDWSDAAYQARQTHRKATKTTAFTYDSYVRSTGVVTVHDQMNPHGVTRESRDSDVHPESLAIAVIFDVTGSMGSVPKVMQTKLGALMRVLIQRGYVAHPQVLFGGVGDATCDRVPLQIGQFESGLEMDEDLGKIYIEGGGGGQVYESYELAMYFMARHTAIDCYEKRGHKGYLFTIGDEKPYAKVGRKIAQEQIGDHLERDLPIKHVIAELHERYEHFHIVPTNTSHGRDPAIQAHWRDLLGERVLMLDDEAAVCETIALTIGICEGTVDDLNAGAVDLVAAGCDRGAAATAASAVTPYAATRSPVARSATGLLPPAASVGDDGRL